MYKKAFTLIELLIVVVIIGVVYGLVIGSMKKLNNKEKHLDFKSLPKFVESFYQRNHVAFVCTDNCRECMLYVDGKPLKKVDAFMRDERQLRFWHYDANIGVQELRFTPLFDEDEREFDVCFRYEMFEDGSSSEMIIETKKQSYLYRGPLSEVMSYPQLQDVEDALQKQREEVLQ